MDYDVLIIGAGAAGLAAAGTLRAKGLEVCILEGRDRIGGRVWTSQEAIPGVPIDMGASWIHGHIRNPVHQLAQAHHIKLSQTNYENYQVYKPTGGEMSDDEADGIEKGFKRAMGKMKSRRHGNEVSLRTALDEAEAPSPARDFQAEIELAHEFAADLGWLSAQHSDEGEDISGNDFVFPEGYSQVTEALLKGSCKGVEFVLEAEVSRIEYGKDKGAVTVHLAPSCAAVSKGEAKKQLTAKAAIVTVPLGILKASVPAPAGVQPGAGVQAQAAAATAAAATAGAGAGAGAGAAAHYHGAAGGAGASGSSSSSSSSSHSSSASAGAPPARIAFSPELPSKLRTAITRLGMGVLNKYVASYTDGKGAASAWSGKVELFGCADFAAAQWGRLHEKEGMPGAGAAGARSGSAAGAAGGMPSSFLEMLNWKKHTGDNVIIAFAPGCAAQAFSSHSDAEVKRVLSKQLKGMFPSLPAECSSFAMTRWDMDRFSLGSYSFIPVGTTAEDRRAFQGAVSGEEGGAAEGARRGGASGSGSSSGSSGGGPGCIWFAGEHTSVDYPATVHGAMQSGERAAAQLLAALD